MYKHTPGPWLDGFDPDDDTHFVYAKEEDVNDGFDIGYFFGPDKNANAFLAALAPDMLPILESLVQHCPPLDSKGRTAHRKAKQVIKWAKKYA